MTFALGAAAAGRARIRRAPARASRTARRRRPRRPMPPGSHARPASPRTPSPGGSPRPRRSGERGEWRAARPPGPEPASFSLDNLAGKAPRSGCSEARTGRRGSAAATAHPCGYGRRLERQAGAGRERDVHARRERRRLGRIRAASAGASFVGGASQATATTTASGIATSPRFVANTTAGRFTATATLAAARARRPSCCATCRAAAHGHGGRGGERVGGDGRSLPDPARGHRHRRRREPGAGRASCTFSAPAARPERHVRGLGARTVRVRTNAAGIAVAPVFTANGAPGGYVVKATAGHAAWRRSRSSTSRRSSE